MGERSKLAGRQRPRVGGPSTRAEQRSCQICSSLITIYYYLNSKSGLEPRAGRSPPARSGGSVRTLVSITQVGEPEVRQIRSAMVHLRRVIEPPVHCSAQRASLPRPIVYMYIGWLNPIGLLCKFHKCTARCMHITCTHSRARQVRDERPNDLTRHGARWISVNLGSICKEILDLAHG